MVAPAPIGVVYGRFVIGPPVASGAHARVHAARELLPGGDERWVRLKIPRGDVDDRLRSWFRRENQILARLTHPAIARWIGGGEVEGVPYVCTETPEGLPLTAALLDARPFGTGARSLLHLALEIAQVLAYLHDHGVVHGSLVGAALRVGASRHGHWGISLTRIETEPLRTRPAWRSGTFADPEPPRSYPALRPREDLLALSALLRSLGNAIDLAPLPPFFEAALAAIAKEGGLDARGLAGRLHRVCALGDRPQPAELPAPRTARARRKTVLLADQSGGTG